jgi:hypothetical protein
MFTNSVKTGRHFVICSMIQVASMCVITCMFVYVCAYVVGIKAPESLCYLLMYINPTLNKDLCIFITLGVTLIKGESTRQVTGNKESENSFLLVYLSCPPFSVGLTTTTTNRTPTPVISEGLRNYRHLFERQS